MKFYKNPSLVFFAAMLLFTACNNSENKTGTSDGYVLKMRMKPGDKFSQDVVTNMDMGFMKMKIDAGYSFEVLDSTAAGKQVKLTYDKMKMSAGSEMLAGDKSLDSTLNNGVSKLIGKSVILTMNGNTVTEVKNADILLESKDSTIQESLKKMYTKENINSMFGMMFNLYPDKAVKIGESWSANNTMDMQGMEMKIDTRYTLLAVKNNIAEISVDGKIDSDGKMNQGGKEIDIKMKGGQSGKMYVKLADGYLRDGRFDMDIDATISMMGQQIPMKIKADYTMTGK